MVDRAVLVLVVLEDRDQRAADRQARAVERVDEARALALLGPEARVHAPRLEVAAVRAAARSRDRRPAPAARPRCRRSCARRSPCRRCTARMMRNGRPSRFSTSSAQPVMRSCSASDCSGRGDADQLDLVELVLADHAARVLAGGARLGAEAGRAGGEAQRQLLLVEDLVVHEVGERHLGGRDQPEAVVGAEQVLGELRQLAGAERRVVAHQERRR